MVRKPDQREADVEEAIGRGEAVPGGVADPAGGDDSDSTTPHRATEASRPVEVRAIKPSGEDRDREDVFDLRSVSVRYGDVYAVKDVTMPIKKNEITALIGPSGCGKTTLIRCLNRMNDLIPSAVIEGSIRYHDIDLYGSNVDPVEVRRHIGMVFQKPNPFPKSIYDNVAFGPRVAGVKADLDEIVERSLQHAALWDEVKGKLKTSALALSGGQQQRLCIARAIAVEPDVILMDEPCSALDPISTLRIEELMNDLVADYTIVIVTHNMQQAARISDRTAFLTVAEQDDGHRVGMLVEYGDTDMIFTNPTDSRTEGYVTGRFG